MYLKIMYSMKLQSSDSGACHKMVEVQQYQFFLNGKNVPTLAYTLTTGEERTEEVTGRVYVLNGQGKTINVFHLPLGN